MVRYLKKLAGVVSAMTLAAACGGESPAAPENSSDPTVKTYPKVSDKVTAGILLDAVEGRSTTDGRTDPIRSVSDAGLGLLKRFEGEVLCSPQTPDQVHCPYDDSSDFCTIGHGHLIAKDSCADITARLRELGYEDGISQAEADDILRKDLASAQASVERGLDLIGKLEPEDLTDAQYDSLVSLTFNIGGANFGSSTLLKKVEARAALSGDVNVAEQFLRWNRSNGVFVPGLLNRRKLEVTHFFTGYEEPVIGRTGEDDGINIRIGETPEQ